jgi:putative peptidoglycan lipid II flippase
LVAKAMVALRDVVIASSFGAGPVADAFNVAFAISTWLPLFLAGAIGAALVPALIRAQRQSSADDIRIFTAELTGHALLLAVTVCFVSLVIAWASSRSLQASNAANIDGIVFLMLALAPFSGLTTLFYFLANRLQAQGSFSYSVVEGLPGLVVAIFVAIFGQRAGLSALATGVLVGGVLQIVVLTTMLSRHKTSRMRPRLTRSSPHWNLLLAGIGIMTIGQALLSLVIPLDQYFALHAGPGVPATFGYANRIVGLATSVGTLVLGRALLPTFAEMAQNDLQAAIGFARRWTVFTLIMGMAVSAIGWFLCEPLVVLMFQRGAFTAADTREVTDFVQLGLLQLPFYFSGIVAVQWLVVCGRFARVTVICLATVATKAVALWVLLPTWGAASLMISTVVMYVVAWILQSASLTKPVAQVGPGR